MGYHSRTKLSRLVSMQMPKKIHWKCATIFWRFCRLNYLPICVLICHNLFCSSYVDVNNQIIEKAKIRKIAVFMTAPFFQASQMWKIMAFAVHYLKNRPCRKTKDA